MAVNPYAYASNGPRTWAGGSVPVTSRMVAVGNSDAMMHSDNGFIWIQAGAPVSGNWLDVAYSPTLGSGQGRWVAVGSGPTNFIAYSDDGGHNWTTIGVSLPSFSSIHGIAWSDDLAKFVMVGQGSHSIAYSSDGKTWTDASFITTDILLAVCWSHDLGIFCAVGKSNISIPKALYSSDGATWHTWNGGFGASLVMTSVAWNSDTSNFCGTVPNDGSTNNFQHVADTTHDWVTGTSTEAALWDTICYVKKAPGGTGWFLALNADGVHGAAISYSGASATWVAEDVASNVAWSDVCYSDILGGSGHGRCIAVQSGGDGTADETMYSDDGGQTWIGGGPLTVHGWNAIAVAG